MGTLHKDLRTFVSRLIIVRRDVSDKIFRGNQNTLFKFNNFFFPPENLVIYEIHSFSILSDDRSKASSKTIPPYSAI